MAAPTSLEMRNLRFWSLYGHYNKHRRMYVEYGRAIAATIRTAIAKAQSQDVMDIVVPENDIADAFRTWLLSFQYWTAYLDKKAHMGGEVRLAMTDTMARFIASDSYADIIK